MTTTILTEAERAYDSLKDGSAYVKPAELPSHLLELRAQIDAETDPDMRKRLICRMADQVLGTSDDEEEDDENPLTEAEEAAYDAANQQKVYDRIKSAFDSHESASLFVDTLNGRINDVPIDLAVMMGIGAAMERNLGKLGITRDQMFQILHVAVNPTIDEYLITPARRMRLIWDGME